MTEESTKGCTQDVHLGKCSERRNSWLKYTNLFQTKMIKELFEAAAPLSLTPVGWGLYRKHPGVKNHVLLIDGML